MRRRFCALLCCALCLLSSVVVACGEDGAEGAPLTGLDAADADPNIADDGDEADEAPDTAGDADPNIADDRDEADEVPDGAGDADPNIADDGDEADEVSDGAGDTDPNIADAPLDLADGDPNIADTSDAADAQDAQDTATPDPYTGTPCTAGDLSGTCQWLSVCGEGMQSLPGFCPGPSDMQCCVPQSTDPYIGTACSVSGVAGVCLDVADCVGDDMTATPGRCPGPAEVQCCTEPPPAAGTCDPTARPLPNEELTEAPGDPGCLPGMVAVTAALCIDRYEAALVEVLADGSTRGWSPYFNPGSASVRAVSLAGAVPQGYINGVQAAAACQRAQKRLCTDTEWLRACQGSPATTYPYGNTRQPGVCNDARAVHPAVEYFGTTASWIYSQINHPCLNQLQDGLAPTGSHPDCATDEGALDMMGNLHEWTADPAGTFRGGFYVDTFRNGNGCLYRTTAHDTSHWDYSTGFRCCADRQ